MRSIIYHIITLSIILCTSSNAQTYVFEAKVAEDSRPFEKKLIPIQPISYSGIGGNPYLYKKYRVGFIWFQDSFYKVPQIKFNLFESRLEMLDKGQLVSFPSDELQCFAILNPYTNQIEHYFNSHGIKFNEINANGFLQKIKSKDYNLFVFYELKMKLPSENLEIMGQGLSPRFVVKKHFYLEKKNWLYIMRNRKDVHGAVYRKHHKKAVNYTKRHKLRYKETTDFLTLFAHLEKVEISL